MIALGIMGGSRRRAASTGPGTDFGGLPALFAAGQKGAYYDFTNPLKLAVNADGSGGVPTVGATAKWAADQSPNGNHLRNTVGTVTVTEQGVVTSGSNYGLFNMRGHGDWPAIETGYEIIATLEQLAFGGTDRRLIDLGGPSLLQGSASGRIRAYSSGYGGEVAPELATEFTVHLLFDANGSSIAINGGAPRTDNLSFRPCAQFVLGSDLGGTNAAAIRFKRLFVRAGRLNPSDRAGVAAWTSA